jgi:glycosyltransferase involved in cell wall biosynthesis
MKISILTSLYKCERHLQQFFDAVGRISNLDGVELLLLHNEPSTSELATIQTAINQLSPMCIRHIIIPQRETLYASWNRGISLARGKYIAVWNVDDIREPDSLERQATTLDKSPEVGLTYGDIIGIQRPGDRTGMYYNHLEYDSNQSEFFRSFHSSCFPMWRKSVHDVVGYFDEQFYVVGDFDFQIRVARRFPLAKTPGLLGYYLEGDPNKLSNAYERLERERSVIELRYGQFDKLNVLFLWNALSQFDVLHMHWLGERHYLYQWFPNYWAFIMSRLFLLPGCVFRLPRNLLRHLKESRRHHAGQRHLPGVADSQTKDSNVSQ